MLSAAHDVDLISRAARIRRAREALARHDGAAFNAYVLRDETTGRPVANAPIHIALHRAIDQHPRLAVFAHIESGKSSSISIGRSLYELGRNRNLRILIVSNTGGQAVKIVRSIANYIEISPEFHRVFPNCRPDEPWTHSGLTVHRDYIAKDPSIAATGVHGAVLGARIDLLILDDILDYENTRTPEQREDLARWYRATLAGRLTENARVIAVGTAWHPEDLMHMLAKTRLWHRERFPIQDKNGASTWPARWSLKRIADKREELGPIEAARQLDCIAVDDKTSRFQLDGIKKCLALGNGVDMRPDLMGDDGKLLPLPEGAHVAVGVDLGFTKKARPGGAKTVFTATLFYADGTRQLLWIESGNFSGPEIVFKALDYHRRFGANVYVESNAAQRLILDFALDPHYAELLAKELGPGFDPGLIPVMPFQTGMNKWHPTFGIESLATELLMTKWLIPNEDYDPETNAGTAHAEVISLIRAMRSYDPNGHTPDHLMSLWFCREGGRGYRRPGTKVRAVVLAPTRPGAEDAPAAEP